MVAGVGLPRGAWRHNDCAMANDEELVSARLLVRFSKGDTLAGLFVEGKREPLAVLPVVGPVDDLRRVRLSRMFIELAGAFLSASGVENLGMVEVNDANKIVG